MIRACLEIHHVSSMSEEHKDEEYNQTNELKSFAETVVFFLFLSCCSFVCTESLFFIIVQQTKRSGVYLNL